MKYVRQIGIILGITLAGEFLNQILPLPVPAGVYGLFLMLAALMSGVVKMESVEGTGNFLMDTMSMMFVPACLLYTSPSPRDYAASRMPSSA